ncbi:hypothetical protein AC1031_016265 [Aphanomyces cochlioides]|nr:hypothetical protein AC1031_016265 [Aphanomyces cochlioides]
MFSAVHKDAFKYIDCWELLKHEPKWQEARELSMTKLNATKLDDKREKKRHLEDISESFETSKSSERPEGSKSAKITAKQEDLLAQSIAAQKSMVQAANQRNILLERQLELNALRAQNN